MPPAAGQVVRVMLESTVKQKVILLGDGSVGKTSLINKFVLNTFDESYIKTLGVRVSRKDMRFDVGGKATNFQLFVWDLYGQKKKSTVQTTALAGVNCAFFVCDLTSPASLDSLASYWYPLLGPRRKNITLMLLGNKVDKKDSLRVEPRAFKEFAGHIGADFFLTSAKTGRNVQEAFTKLAVNTLKRMKPNARTISPIIETTLEEDNLKEAAREIINDFTFLSMADDVDTLAPVIKRGILESGLDLIHPTVDTMMGLVEYFDRVERQTLGDYMATKNAKRRLDWIQQTVTSI